MRLTAQAKKEQIIAGYEQARQELLAFAAALAPERLDEVFLGVWSTKDLLAHLAGWDATNLEAVRAVQAGQLPGFYEFRDPDWRTYNARLVSEYRREDPQELLSLVNACHQALVEALQEIVTGSFEKDFGVRYRGYKVTIARLIQAETGDEQEHCRQLREHFGPAAA